VLRDSRFCLALWPLAALLAVAQPPAGVPDLQTSELATGPYSRMRMLLEKTIFSIDVLTVDVQVDEPTRQRFRAVADGQPYSRARADRIAGAAIDAQQLYVQLEFVRDVPFNRWVDGVRDSLERAWRAGLIREEHYRSVSDSLPRWFQAAVERGFEAGDRILYRGYPDRLRTLLVSRAGDVLLDQTDRGTDPRRALLAGYFAPGTDFREPLIRSLFVR
jgi:hypothetical protein